MKHFKAALTVKISPWLQQIVIINLQIMFNKSIDGMLQNLKKKKCRKCLSDIFFSLSNTLKPRDIQFVIREEKDDKQISYLIGWSNNNFLNI